MQTAHLACVYSESVDFDWKLGWDSNEKPVCMAVPSGCLVVVLAWPLVERRIVLLEQPLPVEWPHAWGP